MCVQSGRLICLFTADQSVLGDFPAEVTSKTTATEAITYSPPTSAEFIAMGKILEHLQACPNTSMTRNGSWEGSINKAAF